MSSNTSPRLLVFLGIIAAGIVIGRGAPADAASTPLNVVNSATPGHVTLEYRGKPILVYAAATNQFKPYVKELYSLSGVNVLLDSPPDHLHHHGLMYAITVNGANFWEEHDTPGYQLQASRPLVRTIASRTGPARAVLSQRLHWVMKGDAQQPGSLRAALLVEDRLLTLTVDEKIREVAVQWDSSFALGPNTAKAVLTGAMYHGLGLRLPRGFDRVARHQNSEGTAYSAEQKGDVTAARWSCISHVVEGKPLSVAMFSAPANKGESKFFTMLDAFAYVSATQGLDQRPLDYDRGSTFSVRYLVTVYPEEKPREFIEQRYQAWIAQ